MVLPPASRFRGWSKWQHVLTFLAIAVGAAFFVTVIEVAVPRDVLAMQLIAAYTALAGLACLVLAVALVLTRRMPAGREATLDGEPAVLFRAWPLQWWFDVATDAALGTLGVLLFALATAGTTEWLLWGLVPLAVGLWFLARAGLALTGRRHNEALWLTEREVVHDTDWGRERCDRSDVADVFGTEDGGRVLVVVHTSVHRQPCPRPFRRKEVRVGTDDMGVDCSLMGHTSDDLARWLLDTVPATGSRADRRRLRR